MAVRVAFFAALLWGGPVLGNSFGSDEDAPFEVCALCHSLDGVSRMAKFPKLAGQPTPYIAKQLFDFTNGVRQNDGGQMMAIVTEISPDDIPIVARWFSMQSAPLPMDVGDVSAGKMAFEMLGCLACHDSARANDMTPHLTAQHAGYLQKQMLEFRDGIRANDPGGMMRAAMRGLTDSQISELATYLAATTREHYETR